MLPVRMSHACMSAVLCTDSAHCLICTLSDLHILSGGGCNDCWQCAGMTSLMRVTFDCTEMQDQIQGWLTPRRTCLLSYNSVCQMLVSSSTGFEV